jgi:hypothetical protein
MFGWSANGETGVSPKNEPRVQYYLATYVERGGGWVTMYILGSTVWWRKHAKIQPPRAERGDWRSDSM